jgi:hypothetical protein
MSSIDSTARTFVPTCREAFDLIATAHWDE